MDMGIVSKARVVPLGQDNEPTGEPDVVETLHADFSMRMHLLRRVADAGGVDVDHINGMSVSDSLKVFRGAEITFGEVREDPDNLLRDTPGNARYAARQMLEAAESAPKHAYWKFD